MIEKITDLFGIDVFNDATMRERLPKKTYEALKKTIENGDELDSNVAEIVANAMKDWAIGRGATHYTHWFHPMTGVTAEKHDSFIHFTGEGKVNMEFSGKELIKGEPDASSFPSGGLRATFEARGYTAWDCTSPAFLRQDAGGVTLCIPTAFCSYTGESLDMKTPLLRSMEVISNQSVRLLKLFGHDDVKRVEVTVGPEQEYFLIDKEKYLLRDDLIFTGRTLFGAAPPKGQEMDDHYFGNIKERVALFMKELNLELWKLGVTAKTQHNETAPAQHELAPIFSTANIATDHNQLVMETMQKIAKRHDLACLLHEKPFKGVNGSGKHNNWSLVTDTGLNLFSPGKKPHDNKQFLLLLSAMLKAVDIHAEILRLAAANPGNDHRLGGDEAPPAIISVFLGTQLEDILAQIMHGEETHSQEGGRLNIGVHTLPELKKDAADRNRTSPFAFTGNKFEFRMVASSMSIAFSNTVMNTIVADVFADMANELEKAQDFDVAVDELIKRTISDHQRIVFNGDGYSDSWVKEAKRRGLPNLESMVDAIPAAIKPETIDVFGKHKVFSEVELRSRSEILYSSYSKTINIEGKTMCSMVKTKILPEVIKYTTLLGESINSVKMAIPDCDVTVQMGLLQDISTLLVQADTALKKLEVELKEGYTKAKGKERAGFYRDNVISVMQELRTPIDQLEVIMPKDMWPIPTYGDLLFEI